MQKLRRMHLVAVMMLTLFWSMTIALMGDSAQAAEESAPPSNAVAESSVVEMGNQDAAVLAWMENEMQMSIDPTEPLGFTPDFTCMEPPYHCPANVRCPDLAGGAYCIGTSCGTGACPTCPNFFGNAVILSWCAYGCMKGKDVVDGAFGFWVRGFGWKGPICFPG